MDKDKKTRDLLELNLKQKIAKPETTQKVREVLILQRNAKYICLIFLTS